MNQALTDLYRFMLYPKCMLKFVRVVKKRGKHKGEYWVYFTNKYSAPERIPKYRIIELKPNGQPDWNYSRKGPK